ncbi:MAG: zinc-finger domain-containing protein [marine bacterium B5-7]|nr:MAG: zinc-finger domain-containing protein [marine bacterium B5-7]
MSQPAASTQRRVELTHADLPLSCPRANERLWDAHPRVFLPIEDAGHATCPYCDVTYVLTDHESHT